MQVWPALRRPEATTAFAAASMSASGNTRNGALPPAELATPGVLLRNHAVAKHQHTCEQALVHNATQHVATSALLQSLRASAAAQQSPRKMLSRCQPNQCLPTSWRLENAPSSIEMRFTVAAQRSIRYLPTFVLPVKPSLRTRGLSSSASPIALASPDTTLKTPAGSGGSECLRGSLRQLTSIRQTVLRITTGCSGHRFSLNLPLTSNLRSSAVQHGRSDALRSSGPGCSPSGRPASRARCTNAYAVRGVCSEGLRTTVQPQAIAGATLRVIMEKGKFCTCCEGHSGVHLHTVGT